MSPSSDEMREWLTGNGAQAAEWLAGRVWGLKGARLLKVRELARLQGLPDNFVLPEGRVVATRLIGNAVPPALIRALLL